MSKTLQTIIGLVLLAGLIVVVAMTPKSQPVDQVPVPGDGIGNPAGTMPTGNISKLVENTWVWVKTEMNDGTVVAPKKSNAFSVKFGTDNQLSGTTDCNNFSGPYLINADDTMTFGPFMSTLMFCEGSQETEFVQAIENSSNFMFTDAGDLVLLLKFDSGSVLFKKQ